MGGAGDGVMELGAEGDKLVDADAMGTATTMTEVHLRHLCKQRHRRPRRNASPHWFRTHCSVGPHRPLGLPQLPPQPSLPHSRPLQSGRQPARNPVIASTSAEARDWESQRRSARTHAVLHAEVAAGALAVGVPTVAATAVLPAVLVRTVR